MQDWLVIADDLTGASDCGIAFARRGAPALVSWHGTVSAQGVLAIDTNSRGMTAAAAAACHRALLEALLNRPGLRLYKKIDSTLRGQPAAELAATIGVLRAQGMGSQAIVAPAFPATGRTTENGRIRVHGQALETTPLWARDHAYPSADLPDVLEKAGLRAALLPLAVIRSGVAAIAEAIHAQDQADCVVCDAATPEDLEHIAAATLPMQEKIFWVGSGGLAHALAPVGPARPCPVPAADRGILIVIGSLAEASRGAAAHLVRRGDVRHVVVTPSSLQTGPGDPPWDRRAHDITAALAAGEDVLVELAAAGADLSQGAALALRLARLLHGAASGMGGLIATGGETARAVLTGFGVHGVRLVTELEPGVPLGITQGALEVPVITKAGAFGGPETLAHCLDFLRNPPATRTNP